MPSPSSARKWFRGKRLKTVKKTAKDDTETLEFDDLEMGVIDEPPTVDSKPSNDQNIAPPK